MCVSVCYGGRRRPVCCSNEGQRCPRVCSHVCAGRRGYSLELAGARRKQKPEAGPGSWSSPSPSLAWYFHHQLGPWKRMCIRNDTSSGFDSTFPLSERDHIFLWPHKGSCVLDLPDTLPGREKLLLGGVRSCLLVSVLSSSVSYIPCQSVHPLKPVTCRAPLRFVKSSIFLQPRHSQSSSWNLEMVSLLAENDQ